MNSLEMPFNLAFKIIENVYKSESNIHELVNDRSKSGRMNLPSKTDFLWTIYQLEEAGYVFRYHSNHGIRYSRTEKGDLLYEKYKDVPPNEWPEFLTVN
ncbi:MULTISPECIES: DUF3116 family protein [Listeria]|uniref:DUF3116 family protein n=2 Tax=Listeriaceae TaxID=186820 RepID=UPI001FCA36DB|nr:MULTISPECIES: DUF3116 family protein [Listeria]